MCRPNLTFLGNVYEVISKKFQILYHVSFLYEAEIKVKKKVDKKIIFILTKLWSYEFPFHSLALSPNVMRRFTVSQNPVSSKFFFWSLHYLKMRGNHENRSFSVFKNLLKTLLQYFVPSEVINRHK